MHRCIDRSMDECHFFWMDYFLWRDNHHTFFNGVFFSEIEIMFNWNFLSLFFFNFHSRELWFVTLQLRPTLLRVSINRWNAICIFLNYGKGVTKKGENDNNWREKKSELICFNFILYYSCQVPRFLSSRSRTFNFLIQHTPNILTQKKIGYKKKEKDDSTVLFWNVMFIWLIIMWILMNVLLLLLFY